MASEENLSAELVSAFEEFHGMLEGGEVYTREYVLEAAIRLLSAVIIEVAR